MKISNIKKYLLHSAPIVLLLSLFLFAEDAKLTELSNRQKLNFNSEWLFYRGEIEEDAAKNPQFDDTGWQSVHLPHAPEITPLRHLWRLSDNENINWYRKHFSLSENYHDQKLYIEFEGADKITDVWINGKHITKHIEPYSPIYIDITDHIKFDESNVVIVKVDNKENRDIPIYGHWISYGGLYRDVYLIVTDRLHITDAIYEQKPAGGGVFVTYPQVTDSLARIRVKTHVRNEYQNNKKCKLKSLLIDVENQIVATVVSDGNINSESDFTFDQLIDLTDFNTWHPDHPYLYTLLSEIYDDNKLVDHYKTRIGIRAILFHPENGFSINEERYKFIGANRVQDYPYVAWAFPNSAQRNDAVLLKEGGFNYLRLSHNPQDPSFLDACDELGILLIDCIPGFQFIGGAKFRENSFKSMRNLIRRDRNHPSIILWELSLNETDFDSSFAKTAMQIGHEEFPGDQCFVAGWKFPEIYDVFLMASQHGARKYNGPAPLVISEYGHWDYGGGNSTSDVEHKDGENRMLKQAHNHQESLNLNLGMPFLCGDGLWVSMDFQCYPSGVIDYFRIPKFSYYFYQSQRNPDLIIENLDSGPMVFIANYWTKDSPMPLKIFSNCDRIDLYINGKLLKSQSPDNDDFSKNLLHPPFTFNDIAWEPGELKAIGFINGKEVASHTRITTGKAKKLELSFAIKRPALANAEDMFFIYASAVDSNSTVVISENSEVKFKVSGSAYLVSPETIKMEAGIASALIRTTNSPGDIIVAVESQSLGKVEEKKKCIKTSSNLNIIQK